MGPRNYTQISYASCSSHVQALKIPRRGYGRYQVPTSLPSRRPAARGQHCRLCRLSCSTCRLPRARTLNITRFIIYCNPKKPRQRCPFEAPRACSARTPSHWLNSLQVAKLHGIRECFPRPSAYVGAGFRGHPIQLGPQIYPPSRRLARAGNFLRSNPRPMDDTMLSTTGPVAGASGTS